MSGLSLDWSAVLSGQPRQWLIAGLWGTIGLTFWASLLATLLAVLLLALRLSRHRPARLAAAGYVTLFRNTPLAVQLLFWYFGGLQCLPQAVRDGLSDGPTVLGVAVPSTEMLVGVWSLGLFAAAFLAEDLRAGVRAVPAGQMEAALSQGFSRWQSLRLVILPQALAHAWQPLIGQYLNLMKNSPLTMSIAVAELMYKTSQIESYNLHGIEAYAVASVLYLAIGLVMSLLLARLGRVLFRHGGA